MSQPEVQEYTCSNCHKTFKLWLYFEYFTGRVTSTCDHCRAYRRNRSHVEGLTPEQVKQRVDVARRNDTYSAWRNMLARCLSPKHVSWAQYGGRGITVWEGWMHLPGYHYSVPFGQFTGDLGFKPSKIHTLDRIDPEGNYTPGNVQWSTHKEQGINKRNTKKVIDPDTGLLIPAATLATRLGIRYQTLRYKMMKEGTWNAAKVRSDAAVPTACEGSASPAELPPDA